jgi:hypothetical protein
MSVFSGLVMLLELQEAPLKTSTVYPGIKDVKVTGDTLSGIKNIQKKLLTLPSGSFFQGGVWTDQEMFKSKVKN